MSVMSDCCIPAPGSLSIGASYTHIIAILNFVAAAIRVRILIIASIASALVVGVMLFVVFVIVVVIVPVAPR